MRGYVIVSGPPASGKSTLAPPLAEKLGLPYLSKDTIKRALIAELGAVDVAASRRLGTAAMRALIATASDVGAGVLDGTWFRDRTPVLVRQLRGPVVEVFCRCPQPVLEARYGARAATRGPGEFDRERPRAELWSEQTLQPVAGGWPLIEVDTQEPVDVSALAERLRAVLANGCAARDSNPEPAD